MQKTVLILAVMMVSLTAGAQQYVIKTNPFGLAFGNFNLTCEKVFSPSSSVIIAGNYTYNLLGSQISLSGLEGNFTYDLLGSQISLGGFGLGYRYYFTHVRKAVPSGFYISPMGKMAIGKVQRSRDTKSSLSEFGIGGLIGYQWSWYSGFTLDLGIGPMYTMINVDHNLVSSGVLPAGIFTVGFAF